MKTTVIYLNFDCPSCQCEDGTTISDFVFKKESLRFESKEQFVCHCCNAEFTPIIHLDEFKGE